LSEDEDAAMDIALKGDGFWLFCNFKSIYDDYIVDDLVWQEENNDCTAKKASMLKAFVDGRKVTIQETSDGVFEISASHPLFYTETRFESLKKPRTITVVLEEGKVTHSDFYQPNHSYIFYYIFTIEDNLLLGFNESLFKTKDYDTMSNRFAEKFCNIEDELFK